MRKQWSAAVLLSLFTMLACAASDLPQRPNVIPSFVGGVRPEAIWHDRGFFDVARACSEKYSFARFHERAERLQGDCAIDYMKHHHASAQAIAFMRYAPVPAQIAQVRHGRAASVVYANMMWADAAGGFALIGKSGEVVPLWTGPDLESDSRYRDFEKQHPGATLWGTSVGWPRIASRPDGGDRFTVTFDAKTCNACAIIEKAEVAYDFDQRGKFEGVRLLKIIAPPKHRQ